MVHLRRRSWTIARDWSSVPALAWKPPTRGAYRIGIWARDATTKAGRRQRGRVSTLHGEGIVRAATGDTTIRTGVPSPTPTSGPSRDHRSDEQPGESADGQRDVDRDLHWRTGGRGPYSKSFHLRRRDWTIARDWSGVPILVWKPPFARRVSHRSLGQRRDDQSGRRQRGGVVPFRVRAGRRVGDSKTNSVSNRGVDAINDRGCKRRNSHNFRYSPGMIGSARSLNSFRVRYARSRLCFSDHRSRVVRLHSNPD